VRLTHDGASLVVEGGGSWGDAGALADRVSALTSVWWEPVGGHRRLVVDRRSAGDDATGGEKPPDASFTQVNSEAATMLHGHVMTIAMAHAPATAVDAYAGAGATAVALANRGVVVAAIELDAAAGRWMAAQLPNGSRAIVGRVEDMIDGVLPPEVVLLNPPRAGVDERVTAALERDKPPRAVVYVSCNPATLARDVQRLPRYRIASLASFDMFPQTAHVETVC
jgi:23S rRNA (uracil1939-C5)-methyltransferase